MFPNDPQMVLFSGKIRKGENVYLHKLPFYSPDGKPQFVQGAHDREFYSIPGVKGIKPTEIKAVPVDKYLNLIRKATPADLELRKKNMKEQGVAETINSAILNKKFKHKQVIGDYTYTATAEDFEGAPLLWIKAYDGNKEIGHILFEIIVRSPGGRRMPSADYLESGGTEVDPAYRNKGIASTMYAYAKMLGNDIRASYNQTSQGKAMWAAWEKAGDAKHLIGTAAESAVGENQGWAATLEESTGQVLDLTKNFSNHQRVHAEVVDVLPSGKVKLRVVVADAVPGKKPTVAVGQALSMAVNYLRRAPRVTEAENIKVEPVAKSLRIQNTQTQPKQNVYVAPDKKKTPAVVNHIKTKDQPTNEDYIDEKWSDKYKQSINCDRPQGFSQRAHCAGRKK
jgi:GNAT superfamily N-acetyltransferase